LSEHVIPSLMNTFSMSGVNLSLRLGAQCIHYPWLLWSLTCFFFFFWFLLRLWFLEISHQHRWNKSQRKRASSVGVLNTIWFTLVMLLSMDYCFSWLSFPHFFYYLCWHSSMLQATYLISLGCNVLTYTIELGKRLKFISAQVVACLDILWIKPSFQSVCLNFTDIFCSI
jgi:hypothetical protein